MKRMSVSIRLDLTKRRLTLLDEPNTFIRQNGDKERLAIADINCRLGIMNTDGKVPYFSTFNECRNILIKWNA